MDQFWPQIGSSFQNVVLRTEGFILLIIIVLAIVLISVLYFIKTRMDSQKETDAHGFFKVQSRAEIKDIFEDALKLNSRFDLRLHGHGREILCAFREFDGVVLSLEPPLNVNIPKKIAGRDVDVFFKIQPQNEKPSFYKFATTVNDVLIKDDYQVLTLDVPQMLELEQKRQHLRLEVPSGYIERLEVRKVSHDRYGNYHKIISSFGDILWEHGGQADFPQLAVMDISGGGIRLKVPVKTYTVDKDFLKSNPMLLISMELLSEKSDLQSAELFHLIGRIKKEYFDGFGNHILGLQYEYKALIDKKNKKIKGWEAVDPDEGVEEVSTWVVKMHLKLFREKGLT